MTSSTRDVDAIKRRMFAAIDGANAACGAENEMPGLREAIERWPDERAAARLPAEVRAFLQRELGGRP